MSDEITFTEQNRGAAWERYIRKQNDELKKAGIADVRKNWEAPTVPGHDHLRREPSAPDFSGAAIVGGRVVPVMFEAKSVQSGDKFRHSRLNGDQLDDLTFRASLGGISFVYVLSGDLEQYVLRVDSDGNIDATEPGCKYSNLIDGFRRQPGETWHDVICRFGWTGGCCE